MTSDGDDPDRRSRFGFFASSAWWRPLEAMYAKTRPRRPHDARPAVRREGDQFEVSIFPNPTAMKNSTAATLMATHDRIEPRALAHADHQQRRG